MQAKMISQLTQTVKYVCNILRYYRFRLEVHNLNQVYFKKEKYFEKQYRREWCTSKHSIINFHKMTRKGDTEWVPQTFL